MNIKKVSAVISLLFLFVYSDIYAQNKMRIAVMDFQADGIPGATARRVSELIRTEMVNVGEVMIIERNQMDKILKEQGIQQMGCTDASCAVQIGQMLSVNKILIGTVMKMGTKIIINGRIVDVEKGSINFAAKQEAMTEDDLPNAVTDFTRKLTARMQSKEFKTVFKTEEKKAVKDEEKKGSAAAGSDLYDSWYFGAGYMVAFQPHLFVFISNSFEDGLYYALEGGFQAITNSQFLISPGSGITSDLTDEDIYSMAYYVKGNIGYSIMSQDGGIGIRPYISAGYFFYGLYHKSGYDGTSHYSKDSNYNGLTYAAGIQVPIRFFSYNVYFVPQAEFSVVPEIGSAFNTEYKYSKTVNIGFSIYY